MSLRFYRHRVNRVEELRSLPPGLGLEFDVRDEGSDVVVTHDAFTTGPTLEEFVAHAAGRPLIVNVKCEGIEQRVLAACDAAGCNDLFLLDCTVPAMVKLSNRGEDRLAVRWSEHEPIESVRAFEGLAAWVWVDCFTHYPGAVAEWDELARDFRLCLVSPELQGHGFEAIPRFRRSLGARTFHAVCTKRPDLWAMPLAEDGPA